MKHIWTYSKSDFAAMATTIIVTWTAGIESGIIAGVALSIFLHLYRTSKPHVAVVGQIPGTTHFRNVKRHTVVTDPAILSLRIDASLYFPNARYIEDLVNASVAANPEVRHVILECPAVNDIDFSALESLEALNHRALELANAAARDSGALVAGNLSNTWEFDLSDPGRSSAVVRSIFEEQVEWAAAGQADFVIAETFGHLGEAMIALETIKAASLPAVITFSPTTEQTCDGYTWHQACKALEDSGADVVGLNCGRGPKTMLPILEQIRQTVSGHVAALPVPYRTDKNQPCFFELRLPEGKNAFPVALDPFLLTRFEMADFALKAKQIGVDYIGICCGAGPHHVRAMAEAIGRSVPASVNSPDISLHPIFGDASSQKKNFRECLYGLKIDN